MNRRNLLGTLLVIVGVAFATLAFSAALGDNRSPPIALGLVSAVLAFAALAAGWSQLRVSGTPHEQADLAPARRPAVAVAVRAE